ncbi:MAG TPA: acyl-CoA dehydrogenase family protein [Candidatus Binatia bacterium]|nr:acyl-CoA dehydrogenase family protein [Candidatus Binatia bacterium]
MQLAWGPAEEAFRAEIAAFIEAHAPPEAYVPRDSESGEEGGIPPWARDWQRTLFDAGWLIPSYPPELGGRNATPLQSLIYMEELAKRGVPRSLSFQGYAIVAPSLLDFGTEEQKKLVRPTLRSDILWSIGMSEPNAGSDLASLRTRAELAGDHFVVNGQKVWTSSATYADYCFCYVRTDSQAPKHKGISVLIIDLKNTPGVEPRPLRHITGKPEFAEVFFNDALVPKENLVGKLNDGWRITLGSLAHERGGLWVQGVATVEHALKLLVELAQKTGQHREPTVRRRLAAAYEQVSSLRTLGYKGFASFAQGGSAPEHSFLKLATSELARSLFELGMELEGAYGVVVDPERGGGFWVRKFFVNFATTIAGGTSEIQRNIIAERILGLPKGA